MHAADPLADSATRARATRTRPGRRALLALPVVGALLMAGTTLASADPRGPSVAGCPVLPADNVWNARVSARTDS